MSMKFLSFADIFNALLDRSRPEYIDGQIIDMEPGGAEIIPWEPPAQESVMEAGCNYFGIQECDNG